MLSTVTWPQFYDSMPDNNHIMYNNEGDSKRHKNDIKTLGHQHDHNCETLILHVNRNHVTRQVAGYTTLGNTELQTVKSLANLAAI